MMKMYYDRIEMNPSFENHQFSPLNDNEMRMNVAAATTFYRHEGMHKMIKLVDLSLMYEPPKREW